MHNSIEVDLGELLKDFGITPPHLLLEKVHLALQFTYLWPLFFINQIQKSQSCLTRMENSIFREFHFYIVDIYI